jgi:hypothetical protein
MKEIFEKIKKLPSYKSGDFSKAILEYCSTLKTKKQTYLDFFNFLKEKHGEEISLIYALENYYQQIDKSSHEEYFKCGLANGEEFGDETEAFIQLHSEMRNSYESLLVDKDIFDNFYNILRKFRINMDTEKYTEDYCQECGGSGEVGFINLDYDEITEPCSVCGGTGYMDIENDNFNNISNYEELEDLDFEFNKIKKEWYIEFNEWIFDLIKKNL